MSYRTRIGACLVALLAAVAPAGAAEPTRWKLVVLAFGSDEFLIADVTQAEDGSMSGKIVDAQQFLGMRKVKSIETQGESIKVTFDTSGSDTVFTGAHRAPDEPILGTLVFRDAVYPARVERTDAEKVATLSTGEVMREVTAARQVRDGKERDAKLADLLKKYEGEAASYHIRNELLRTAAASDATEADVRKQIDAWLDAARPYGEAWAAETRAAALKALAGKKPYATLAKELATEAEKGLGEAASLKQKAEAARLLASAAELAGDAALAREAGERSARFEALLDEEYRATVPPFKPEPFAGREQAGADRVVLMELFTGAQCPPCVAADVAFDALMAGYKPSELIGLQYHLHIPGPDPLTNTDSEARSSYYTARSTPTVLLNGEPLPETNRGGGPMAAAEMKYGQYRKLIDGQLDGRKRAAIDLKATREGDSIRIVAEATAVKGEDADKGEEKAGEGSKPRLRLVLTEESIRYVGGNGLRFHHHVVRALPGGADGKELTDGTCRQELSVDLNEVRAGIESYLSDFEKTRSFPNPLPGIGLEGLSVVAFVQDDADKQVWHAVQVPVGEAK
jgi:hypothetical protein